VLAFSLNVSSIIDIFAVNSNERELALLSQLHGVVAVACSNTSYSNFTHNEN